MKIIRNRETIELTFEEEKAFDVVCTVLGMLQGESKDCYLIEAATNARASLLDVMDYCN